MSYSKYDDNGTEFYLCWNCGHIHINEIETQQCKEDDEFINKCLDKRKKESEKRLVLERMKKIPDNAKLCDV